MKAGRLRHFVLIERNANPPTDDYGAPSPPNWIKFEERWCSIEPLSGEELIAAQHVVAGVTHRVGMRFLDGLDATMRLRDGLRLFNIRAAVNVGERSVEHELLCRETV